MPLCERLHRQLAAAAALFLAAAGAAPARAEGAPRERDGFFLRVGVGGGPLSVRREGRVGVGGAETYLGTSTIAGGGGAFELALGGALRPGLVLSGLFSSQQIGDPTMEREGDSDLRLEGPLTFVTLGAAIDWFPNPRGGFHVGGAAAIAGAWVKSPKPAFTEHLGGAGGALSVHVGYLFWVADEWSLGALLRFTGARLHGETTQLGVTGSEDDDVRGAALLFGAVFN